MYVFLTALFGQFVVIVVDLQTVFSVCVCASLIFTYTFLQCHRIIH